MRAVVVLLIFLGAYSYGLVGGAPVLDHQFPSVFIWTSPEADLKRSYCTSARVGTEWILTAAHCVMHQTSPKKDYFGPWVPVPSLVAGNSIQYSFSRRLEGESIVEKIEIVEIGLPRSVRDCISRTNTDPSLCEYRTPLADVAFIRVVPTGSFRSAPISRVSRRPVSPSTWVWIAGYGMEEDGARTIAPRLKSHLVSVSSPCIMDWVLSSIQGASVGLVWTDYFFGVYSDPKVRGHANLGSGDSGGPVYNSRTHEIVGVNSDGFCPSDTPDCQVTNNSFFSRLDILEPSDWPAGVSTTENSRGGGN